MNPLSYLVLKHPLFHPTNGKKIIKRCKQPIPNAIMALTGGTRIVTDGNFGDGKTFDFKQGRQKTMHSFEKLEVGDALMLKGAITTPGIGDILSGHFITHPVGDARRYDADKAIALAARLDTRTADAVELLQCFQKLWHIARIVLEVGIQGHNVSASRRIHARPQCR